MKRAAVAGVDEAGLGPTLGPLVFGATLFRGEAGALADLYRALDGVVAREPTAAPRRLPIDDSKRLFGGRRSFAPLELTALSTLRPREAGATRLEDLLDERSEGPGGPGLPPWYRTDGGGRELPREVDAALVQEWRERWPAELAARGLDHVATLVRPVLEGELNGCFERGLNKAQAELTRLAPILRRLAALAPDGDLSITVDRLGGRRYYADFLRTVFPLRPIAPIEESEARSSYAVREGGRTIELAFEVEGDGRHLHVALASVCAKYLRELFLRRLNVHFEARKPGLAPTAGYPQDAARWLADAADVLSDAERSALVRRR